MQILKEGKTQNKNPHFICKHCGCEFICNAFEYWTDQHSCLTFSPPQRQVYASCPTCHRICSTTIIDDSGSITVARDIPKNYCVEGELAK